MNGFTSWLNQLSLKTWWNTPFFVVALCLTLGLAPYIPEPHLFGKVRWLLGGANGMQAKDYFDFVMHATPWILLIRLILVKIKVKITSNKID